MLFSAGESDSRGEGSALASRKLPEIGGVDVVRYDVGILPVDSIHHLDARGPQISAKGELFFLAPGLDSCNPGKAMSLALQRAAARDSQCYRDSRCGTRRNTELNLPYVRRRPAPGEKTVRSVPSQRGRLLSAKENRTERRVEHLICVCAGARVRAVDLCVFRKNVTQGGGCRAITVLARILQKESSAGLRRILVDIHKTVIAVARASISMSRSVFRRIFCCHPTLLVVNVANGRSACNTQRITIPNRTLAAAR
jgi:hypothetical protein